MTNIAAKVAAMKKYRLHILIAAVQELAAGEEVKGKPQSHYLI
ncbi:hypothetical protein QUA86_21550 [Microcoleus sp. F6_B6]